MKIVSVETRRLAIPLARPYSIAFKTVSEVENFLVVLRDDAGRVGLGNAAPSQYVTGETTELTAQALRQDALSWLIGQDVRTLPALLRRLQAGVEVAPAACAAVDGALHDLWAQHLGLPLCIALGRVHDALPTSITVGIKSTEEALAEVDEYLGRGFRVLKVKTGKSLAEDIERVTRIRERVGTRMLIRADANQGYTLEETRRFFEATENLAIEFLEQPVKAADTASLRALSAEQRARIAADESLLSPSDALSLVEAPYPVTGIFNIKLMKSGGIGPARRIADIADTVGVHLMWGCNDESCVSISAALHAALASPATRYLDLDGSLDLARDVATGGFVIEQGMMRPADGPGLGLRLNGSENW